MFTDFNLKWSRESQISWKIIFIHNIFRITELPEEASNKDDDDPNDAQELIANDALTMDTKLSSSDLKMIFNTKIHNLDKCVEITRTT